MGHPAVHRIASGSEAEALAHHLVERGRLRPTVVVTIAGGHDEPFADVKEILESVGDLADVVLMPTSDISWAFSRTMPERTQVYGGAGRVYPLGHAWILDPALSPPRFAYSMDARARVTEQLINDALSAALAGDLLAVRPSRGLDRRDGRVGMVVGSRAIVILDDGRPASVWEELTVPGVGLDRVLAPKQRVTGLFDPASGRLDLRGELRFIDEADARAGILDAYDVGDLVLAEVAALTDQAVSLRLLPGLAVEVERSAVTANAGDSLPGLFTVGEVVVGRLTGDQPVTLRLDDLHETEDVRPAPSLLPGGPPWLQPAKPDPDPEPAPPPVLPTPVVEVVPVADQPRRPSPLDFGRPRPGAVAPATASLDEERTRTLHLTNELAAERATRSGMAAELAALRARAAELEAGRDHLVREVERLQTRYRRADLARQGLAKQLKRPSGREFDDPGDQFRYDVFVEWLHRIPAGERTGRPLASYTLGPDFLGSVDRTEGVSRSKVVAVVVEVLTGLVHDLPGRETHQLRDGGAGSPYVSRADKATCWRVALQQDTPAARRLHYWRLRDTYELSRISLHDDYRC
jgi:hypothetical protein